MHSESLNRAGAWLAMLLWLCCAAVQAQPFTGFNDSVVRFASIDEGRKVLGADDEWIAATSVFQRSAVMDAPPPVSRDAFLAFSAGAVIAWQPAPQARWRAALEKIAPAFNALGLHLPGEVLIINSDGRESANTPYTRANAVVLPAGRGSSAGYSDEVLIAHELFHVVSRHDPALATRLYAAIGFEPVAPLQWPAAWLPLRIANPDAPHDRHLMRTRIAGRDVALMPLWVAKRANLDRSKGETFFDVLDVRLVEVLPGRAGAPSMVLMRDGQPVWHSLDAAGDYLQRLGGNTGYVIHPEETMADNVAFLVCGSQVRNPALLERIKAVLLAPRPH